MSGLSYQLFAYLRNGEAAGPLDRDATGLLLYAGDTQSIDLRTIIRGHRVHVRSLRLSQPWDQVARDLLAIVYDASRA